MRRKITREISRIHERMKRRERERPLPPSCNLCKETGEGNEIYENINVPFVRTQY